MERINLSILSGVSHEGMLQLKSYVDMTGSDPQHQSYDYECLFPETCNPREICLSFIKLADKYIFRVNPHFRYDGGNSVMGILADTGTVSFSSWQDAEQALRSLSEEGTKSTISNTTPDTLTNWDEISVPEASELKTPSFEHLKERLQKMVIGQDDSTEAVAYIVAQHLAKKNPTKPVSILASGPPGVGKSETAKALAKILSQDCGQEYAVSWNDLNNFTEAFSVYRLIGARIGVSGASAKYRINCVLSALRTLEAAGVRIYDEFDKPAKLNTVHVPWHFPLRLAKTKEVLGLPSLEDIDLKDYISEIVCGKDYDLTYIMNSGAEVKTIWHPYSRKDSWNEEMRQQARNRTLERSTLYE